MMGEQYRAAGELLQLVRVPRCFVGPHGHLVHRYRSVFLRKVGRGSRRKIRIAMTWPIAIRSVRWSFHFADVEPIERSLLGGPGDVHVMAVVAGVQTEKLPAAVFGS